MAATKKQGKTKRSGKRELIAPKGDKRNTKRDGNGRVKESDDRQVLEQRIVSHVF